MRIMSYNEGSGMWNDTLEGAWCFQMVWICNEDDFVKRVNEDRIKGESVRGETNSEIDQLNG